MSTRAVGASGGRPASGSLATSRESDASCGSAGDVAHAESSIIVAHHRRIAGAHCEHRASRDLSHLRRAASQPRWRSS
ncbi:hypothetical protein DB32_008827 [Sandaracinus amylolyticus]|uniref:Uncharacterized protein n=1 Tax=Sandaracinus amylolyticus TaxID=927083 RepID=A0A0F6YN05_9BACT|nr:hypothetical protein DB32_008827 [Sandaracinus amylolyticus]